MFFLLLFYLNHGWETQASTGNKTHTEKLPLSSHHEVQVFR